MKETKFYMIFMVYLAIFSVLGMFAFDYVIKLTEDIESYTLGVTIIIPLLILILYIIVMLATKLAFATSFKKNDKIGDLFLKSFKVMLEGIGVVIILLPIYFIISNTYWTIQTGFINNDLVIGGIIVASLIVVGGISVLAQTYVSLKSDVEKQNAKLATVKTKAKK